MEAMIRTDPPHARQVSMSIPKTRFRRCAQVIAARRSLGVGSSFELNVLGDRPPLPRLALVTRPRYRLLGAKIPWNRVRLARGLGTKAAKRAMTEGPWAKMHASARAKIEQAGGSIAE